MRLPTDPISQILPYLAGRFDRMLHISPTDRKSRIQIISIDANKIPLAEDASIEWLADRTDWYTGADIAL